MANLYDLDPGPDTPEVIRMIVEIPKNSANKYEYDGKLGVFRLDPLDVLTLMSEPSFTGCLIEVRPLGFLELVDSSERDQKILAVPKSSPRYSEIATVDQVWPHMRREIEHFFTIYKELEGKETRIEGWRGPIDARKLILDCRQAYLDAKAETE
jgi:inorganic pyrophosphatase